MPDETHIIVNPDRSDAAAEIVDLADTVERPDGADELADAASRAADADIVAAVGVTARSGRWRKPWRTVTHRSSSCPPAP